ncbi:GNAT family N-acetyltransferase [Streptomyces sp. NA02950]|uniref:GNAT family N-acetyltransferase n=1 Tax=Streptomyces sp. NA02950 TaxID=2742137 RepID=UPI0015904C62|nr:GNAT family N-acetyltransferase [Streptomyces sp. NA02950]QKV96406.1 GNAT family N-acetyltransferase [Streptomyces sp. NA02950]
MAGPDGEAVLGAPAFLTDSDSHPGYDPARFLVMDDIPEEDVAAEPGGAAALARLRGRLRTLESRPSVVSGSPGRMGGVSYAGTLSPRERADALGLATDALERQAEAASAELVCWVYFIEDADATVDTVLRERGYTRVSVGADCHLPITWDSFDGYLRGFSAKRRWSIQREVRGFAEAGVTVERHGAEALGPELAGLELQWRRKYGRKADLEATVADYRELREHVGDAMTVFVARRQGRALGFVTFIEDGPVWWARFPGFDYSAGSDIYLYFNLLFYHPIQVAISEGISSISYSMGSYETKCSRGCAPRHLLAYVRTAGDAGLAADLEVADRIQHRRFDRIARAHTHRGRG